VCDDDARSVRALRVTLRGAGYLDAVLERVALRSSPYGADARHELARPNGFGEIGIGAVVECADLLVRNATTSR
jgi:hypothetical protein